MKKVILGLATLSLMACSNSDSSKSNTGEGALIPEKISEQPLVQKATLTDAQKQEIKQFMAGSNLLPDSELMIPATSESDSEKARRLKKIQKLSKEQKEILDGVIAHCEIPAPAVATEGDTNKPGSKSTTTSKGSVSGGHCPIQYEEDRTSENLVQSSNFESLKEEFDKSHDPSVFDKISMVQNIKSQDSAQMTVLSAELQKQTGITERSSTNSSSGVMVVSGKTAASHSYGTAQFFAKTLGGQSISVDASNEVLNGKDQKVSAYFRYDFHMPSSDPTLQIYMSSEGNRYYLNGQQLSEQEAKDLFGNSFGLEVN